jgi:hypothetical protein
MPEMNDIAIRARAALWWVVPLLVALALVAWETDFGRAFRRVPPAEDPVPPRPVVTSLLPEYTIAGGTATRQETVQRTLFNPTRRPAPVLAADAAKQRMQRGQFALTGTMVIGDKNTAFLRETAGGKSRRVIQGETINGLLVADVKPDRVRLALGDESEELVLRVATNPRPTAQAATPAAVPPTTAMQAVAADAAAPAPGNADGASLAERRRAARAAQSAVQQQATPPAATPPAPARGPAAATPTAPAADAAAPDPRWGQMDQQYRNRGVTK